MREIDNKDFSEILNNSKDLTLGQILKLILKLKYKTIALLIAIFLAITGSAYIAGEANSKNETAVMLQSPFSMRILLNNKYYDFDKLTLIEDPLIIFPEEGKTLLSLRQIISSFDIIPIGQIVAPTNIETSLPIWNWIFSNIKVNNAYASIMIFDWNNHINDYKFKEKHINENIIHRHYYDGCVLEYRLDKNRRSIPSSFVWIEKTH